MIDKSYIDRLKAIPIADYLADQGFVPAKQIGSQLVYISPLTGEKSPSFFVHPQKNVFNCFSSSHKGDIITLVREMEQLSFSQALQRLNHLSSSLSESDSPDKYKHLKPAEDLFTYNQQTHNQQSGQIEILAVKTLSNRVLINYLYSRGIDAHLAAAYLKEAYFRVQGKNLFALALQNDKGGYELRNAFYKGCALAKAPTTIAGLNPGMGVNIFEGFFDFLSALTYYKTDAFESDSIILNSLWLFDTLYQNQLMEKYDCFDLFLDNDRPGWKNAIEFKKKVKKSHLSKTLQNHSSIYAYHKDFNLFLLTTLANTIKTPGK